MPGIWSGIRKGCVSLSFSINKLGGSPGPAYLTVCGEGRMKILCYLDRQGWWDHRPWGTPGQWVTSLL